MSNINQAGYDLNTIKTNIKDVIIKAILSITQDLIQSYKDVIGAKDRQTESLMFD